MMKFNRKSPSVNVKPQEPQRFNSNENYEIPFQEFLCSAFGVRLVRLINAVCR